MWWEDSISVPKDGSRVLAGNKTTDQIAIVRWFDKQPDEDWIDGDGRLEDHEGNIFEATHWMRLPEMP